MLQDLFYICDFFSFNFYVADHFNIYGSSPSKGLTLHSMNGKRLYTHKNIAFKTRQYRIALVSDLDFS